MSYKKTALILLPALAMMPGIAIAATDAFTIYAYGNGNVLRQIFEGMKGIVADAGYRKMLLTMMLLTLIFAITRGYLFGKPSAGPIVGIVLAAFALNVAIFSPTSRTTVHIEDPVHSEDYLVSDVPLILGASAALSSEMSRYMVKLIEGYYIGASIPQQLWMSRTNTYNFPQKIMAGFKAISISDPMTRATFNSYVRECVVPAMYQGRIAFQTMLYGPAETFWNSLKVENLARASLCFDTCGDLAPGASCTSTVCPVPLGDVGTTLTAQQWREGQPAPCPKSHEALGTRISDLIGATAFNGLGNTMLRDTSILDGVVSSTVTHLTGVTGGSGVEHYQRAAFMNMFRDASSNVIANGGSPGVIQVLGVEQAKAAQKTNWMIAGEVFGESVAYLWAALHTFIFAIFPLAVVLMLFPGIGPKVFVGYFSLLVWVALWMPFLAVINYLSISWLAEDIRQLAMHPLSYASMMPISDAGSNMMGVTTFLGTMVPMLTYGIVSGGQFAFTALTQDISAPRSAQKQAENVAAKSYSYESIAANNTGMNKFDSTTAHAVGYDAVKSLDGVGAVTHSRIQSWAGDVRAGQAVGASVTHQVTGRDGALSSAGTSSGQSFSFDSYSDVGVQRAAQIAASAGAMSQTGAQAIQEASRQRGESWQQFVSAASDATQNFKFGRSVNGQISADAAGGVKGALGLAGIGAAMIVGAGDRLDERTSDRFIAKLHDDGASAREFVNRFGASARSDPEAHELIRQVGSGMFAVKSAAPSISNSAAANAIGLHAMSALSDHDLTGLRQAGVITDASASVVEKLRATGTGTRSIAGLTLAGAGVAAGGATIGAAVSGAALPAAAAATLGILGMTDARTGGAARFAVGEGYDVNTGADRREGASLQSGTTFTDALATKEAASRSRTFTSAIDASFSGAASSSSGERVRIGDSGQIIVSAGESHAADEGYTITQDSGPLGWMPERFGEYRVANESIDATKARIHGNARSVSDDIETIQSKVADTEEKVQRPLTLPTIQGGASSGAAGAVQARVGQLSAGDAGSPQSFAQPDDRLRIAVGGQSAISERFKGPVGDIVKDAAARGHDAVRIGANVVAMPMERVYASLLGGRLSATKVERLMDGNKLAESAIREAAGGKVGVRSLATQNGALVYELQDMDSGKKVVTAPDREGNLQVLDDPTNRANVGSFLQSAGGALIAKDPSKYAGAKAESAGEAYWADSAAGRAAAEYRIKTGSDAPPPTVHFDPAALKR